jgi:hypothetical protein
VCLGITEASRWRSDSVATTVWWCGRVVHTNGDTLTVGVFTVSRLIADTQSSRIAGLVLEASRAPLRALLDIREPIVLSWVAEALLRNGDRSALVDGVGIDDLAERNTLVWPTRDGHHLV